MKIPFTNYTIGRAEKPQQAQAANASQIRDSWDDPLKNNLHRYIDLRGDLNLYDTMRSFLPVLDVAVIKRANLIGDFEIIADDRVKQYLEWFMGTVNVGWFGRGLHTWMRQMIDSAICKGFGVGELVPDIIMRGVDRLKVGRANEFRFTKSETSGRLELCQVIDNNLLPIKLENQDLLYYLAFDQRDGHPQGISMFAGLPFLSEIVARINKAVDNAVWRVGDPTFVGLYKAGSRDTAQTVQSNIDAYTERLSEAMKARRQGRVMDIGFGFANDGDFEIEVLGGNSRLMDVSVPLKSCLEQIIARTGLPPYMFGLSWATTERMSKEQSDMLVSEIQSEREVLDPIIEKVLTTALILNGMAGAKWEHQWYDVNLMDEKTQADAALANANALNAEVTAMMQLYNAGFDTSEAMINLAERAGWIEEGEGMSYEARVEAVRAHVDTLRKIALARLSVE